MSWTPHIYEHVRTARVFTREDARNVVVHSARRVDVLVCRLEGDAARDRAREMFMAPSEVETSGVTFYTLYWTSSFLNPTKTRKGKVKPRDSIRVHFIAEYGSFRFDNPAVADAFARERGQSSSVCLPFSFSSLGAIVHAFVYYIVKPHKACL
jgi:hypothetical protein